VAECKIAVNSFCRGLIDCSAVRWTTNSTRQRGTSLIQLVQFDLLGSIWFTWFNLIEPDAHSL
jgi:hypothetical protein